MSNLDYPISVLIAEGGKITTTPVRDASEMKEKSNKLYAINRAIDILNSQKGRDENDEREIEKIKEIEEREEEENKNKKGE